MMAFVAIFPQANAAWQQPVIELNSLPDAIRPLPKIITFFFGVGDASSSSS